MSDVLLSIQHDANNIVVAGSIFVALVVVTVAVRIISRFFMKIQYGIEDALLLIALAFYLVTVGLSFAAIISGSRADSETDALFADFLKYIYISGVFYCPTILFTNLSILALYRRIFTTPAFLRLSLIMILFNVAWFIAGFLVETLACLPVEMFWDPQIPGSCIWYSTFWMIIGIAEILNDIVLLAMPIYQVSKLQMATRKRAALSFVFVLGGISIVTGLLRLGLGYIPGSMYIDLAQDTLWNMVHLGTNLLCACLPTLRPLASKCGAILSSVQQYYRLDSARSGYSGQQKQSGQSTELSGNVSLGSQMKAERERNW